jgi:ribulose-5-phosphate 4-epimerase/fuculose-1-phosphate aldolase
MAIVETSRSASLPNEAAAPIEELNLLAKASRILEISGHGDRIYGHIAMRDSEGRGFWLKRSGISLGEVFDYRDFLLVGFGGEVQVGDGERHSEWPIHAEVLKRRPDINFTAHTHPFYGVIYSSITEPLPILHTRRFQSPPRYEGSSDFIITPEEGSAVAQAMGEHMMVMMRHHGVVFCGQSRLDLLSNGIGLEEACHEALLAGGSGLTWTLPPKDERTVERRIAWSPSKREENLWGYYCRMLERAERAGDVRLSTGRVA